MTMKSPTVLVTAALVVAIVVATSLLIVAGTRAITSGPGKEWGISVYTPVIVKYRDAKTDTKIQLEDLLR